VQVAQVVDATKVALLQQGQQVVPLVVVLAPLVPTTFISTRSLASSIPPSALAQVVVVAVEHRAQRLVAQAQQVGAVQVVVVVAARRQEHAVHRALVATGSCWSMKCTRNEQSMRHTKWHRPQHHRVGPC
jgi:hypothetical protein